VWRREIVSVQQGERSGQNLPMTQPDRDRLVSIRKATKGVITRTQAAEELTIRTPSELTIGWIPAHVPQAKSRVERRFYGTGPANEADAGGRDQHAGKD
jgi:hypothetical protein